MDANQHRFLRKSSSLDRVSLGHFATRRLTTSARVAPRRRRALFKARIASVSNVTVNAGSLMRKCATTNSVISCCRALASHEFQKNVVLLVVYRGAKATRDGGDATPSAGAVDWVTGFEII